LSRSTRDNLLTENTALTSRRPEQAHQAAYRSGLAGAVRTEITEDFTLFDIEGQVLDAAGFAVSLRQCLDLDYFLYRHYRSAFGFPCEFAVL